MFDSVRALLMLLDAELKVERVSAHYLDRFQARQEETLGRSIREIDAGQWNLPALVGGLEALVAGETTTGRFEADRELPRLGRRAMVVTARALPSVGGGRPRVLLSIEDVTGAQRAQEASALKDDFLAGVAHELRGPLSAIGTWVHVLMSGHPDQAMTSQALAAIARGVHTEARLIDDLLDLSRAIEGKLILTHRHVDLVPIVATGVEAVRSEAALKTVEINLVGPENAPILGDPDRLQQVVANLLAHVLKLTPRRGSVRVWVGLAGPFWEIAVTHSVHATPPSASRAGHPPTEGSTLQTSANVRLAVVRHLVALHDGVVAASMDERAREATIAVRLPVHGAEASPPATRRDPSSSNEGDPGHEALAGRRILLVDDEPDAREALTAVLEHYGATVTAVGSAQEASAAMEAARPDLVVSDLGLPGQDGFDLIRRIRTLPAERGGRVPALAVSAYSSPNDRRRGALAGFQAHLAKPVKPIELVTAMLELLASRSAT